jgi:hypothetical protein
MKYKRMKKWKVVGLLIFILLFTTEILLRQYGFCDAVLMMEDKDYEYIAIPQERNRFGRRIYYNRLSQRSNEYNALTDTAVICAFGDSFINGGTIIDQDSLAITKFEKYLSKNNKFPIRILNISSGSWGPDNCYAYLKKHGRFNSRQFLLFVSSHDAYDNMDFKKIVGVNYKYPTKQYQLALAELLFRYAIPKTKIALGIDTENLEINKKETAAVFNPGFQQFYDFCKSQNISLTAYLHADKQETEEKAYNEQGRMIIDFFEQHQIPMINELNYNLPLTVFRDRIHFSDEGQDSLYAILKRTINYRF